MNYNGTKDIVISKVVGNRQYVAKLVKLEFEEVPEGYFFKEPTFQVGWHDAEDFLAAFREALEGEKLPESGVERELKATKYHLEDMRKLAELSE